MDARTALVEYAVPTLGNTISIFMLCSPVLSVWRMKKAGNLGVGIGSWRPTAAGPADRLRSLCG